MDPVTRDVPRKKWTERWKIVTRTFRSDGHAGLSPALLSRIHRIALLPVLLARTWSG